MVRIRGESVRIEGRSAVGRGARTAPTKSGRTQDQELAGDANMRPCGQIRRQSKACSSKLHYAPCGATVAHRVAMWCRRRRRLWRRTEAPYLTKNHSDALSWIHGRTPWARLPIGDRLDQTRRTECSTGSAGVTDRSGRPISGRRSGRVHHGRDHVHPAGFQEGQCPRHHQLIVPGWLAAEAMESNDFPS